MIRRVLRAARNAGLRAPRARLAEMLGVQWNADLELFIRAKRKVVLQIHPDKLFERSEEMRSHATEAMKALNDAYDTVTASQPTACN